MPMIPEYNQWATEEAGLTRAKRRVIKNMESGIVKMTEKPDKDLTDGEADVVATKLIAQFEDLTALFRQINAYFGEGEGGEIFLEQGSDVVKAMTVVIMSAKAIARILRSAKGLVPIMRYMDLGILSDLKAVQAECHESAVDAFGVLRRVYFDDNVDFNEALQNEDELSQLFDFEDEFDPDEPTGNTVQPDEEYSIQSDPTGGLPSRVSSRRRRGRPAVQGSKAYLLEQANRAIRELERAEADRQLREASKQWLIEQFRQDEEQRAEGEQVEDTDDLSTLTGDDDMEGRPKAQFKRIDRRTFEKLVEMMSNGLTKAMELLDVGYNNFNKFRKQRVLRATKADADVGNAVKTASGMRGGFSMVQGTESRMGGKVYRVGGSSNLLYEREGLPRFL